MKPLYLPSYSRIKQLAGCLKLRPSIVLKDLTQRRHGKLYSYCPAGGVLVPHWMQFRSPKDVLVPYSLAAQYTSHLNALAASASAPDKAGSAVSVPAPMVQALELDKGSAVAATMRHLQSESSAAAAAAATGSKTPPHTHAHTHTQVMALLGHFNHGKTSLLDCLSGTRHVLGEATGITQTVRSKRLLLPAPGQRQESSSSGGRAGGSGTVSATLVDTPGQDIFYRMRNYGAAAADAVLLVVSAAPGEDFSSPQTAEAVGVAEELGLPVVVALNKVDLLAVADARGGGSPCPQVQRWLFETQAESGTAGTAEGISESALATAAALIDSSVPLSLLREQGRGYTVLAEAPFVPVSATGGLHTHLLKRVMGETLAVAAAASATASAAAASAGASLLQGQEVGGKGGTELEPEPEPLRGVTGTGMAMDVNLRVGQGVTIQTILRTGTVGVGDIWTSGGWAGRVRAVHDELTAFGDSEDAPADAAVVASGKKEKKQQVFRGKNNNNKSFKKQTRTGGTTERLGAGSGCRVVVKLFEENAPPRPLGDVILFYAAPQKKGSSSSGGGIVMGGGVNSKEAKVQAQMLADAEQMAEAHGSFVIPHEQAAAMRLQVPKWQRRLGAGEGDYSLDNDDDGDGSGDGDADEEEEDEHLSTGVGRSIIVKASSEAVTGTISDAWQDLLELGVDSLPRGGMWEGGGSLGLEVDPLVTDDSSSDGSGSGSDGEASGIARAAAPRGQLLYCGVGDVTHKDVTIALDARAVIITLGVRVQADAARAGKSKVKGKAAAHIPPGPSSSSKKKRKDARTPAAGVGVPVGDKVVGGVRVLQVRDVAEVVDMLRRG